MGNVQQQINLAKYAYVWCLVWASHLIATRTEPDWLRARREVVQDVAKAIGLTTTHVDDFDALMSIVLASDLAEGELSEPGVLQPKAISKKLEQLRAHLLKAQDCLRDLQRASRPKALECELGSPDPYQELAECILRFLARSAGVTPNRGRPPGVAGYAGEKLESFIEHHNPNLSVDSRVDLVDRLLALVSEHRNAGSPSYKHLRARRLKSERARSSRSPSRKKRTQRA